jgi:hypothetical protein
LAVAGGAQAAAVFALVDDRAAGVSGVAALSDGSFLYSDPLRRRVVRVFPSGRRTIFAGNRSAGGEPVDGAPAAKAPLLGPGSLDVMPDGSVLIADTGPAPGSLIVSRVRRVTPTGKISTVAGGTTPGPLTAPGIGDGGPATQAPLGQPISVEALRDGGFLIADRGQERVRRVSPAGTITTLAGSGPVGVANYSGEGGPAASATLGGGVADVAAASDGGILVTAASRVLRIDGDGLIHTVAGNGQSNFSGDGGPARRARISGLPGIEPAADGGYVIVHSDVGRLRWVTPGGIIDTLAGSGSVVDPEQFTVLTAEPTVAGFYYGEGGDPRQATLDRPVAITRDPLGGWLIAEQGRGVSLLAPGGARRMGVALAGADVSRHGLPYVATAAGSASLELRQRGTVVATARGSTHPGRNRIRLPHVSPGLYAAVLRARGPRGTVDRDRLGIVLGGRLSGRLARQAILRDPSFYDARAADAATEELGQCRRYGARRVDCKILDTELYSCEHISSERLGRDGLLYEAGYKCARHGGFRRRPHLFAKPYGVPFL